MERQSPQIMGILNVTPDSFSDGGRFTSVDDIGRQVEQMLENDVDIIDVGGESTRPFAQPVSVDEELKRVIPAIECIRRRTEIPVSIDTTKAEVARQALAAGADMVNDISALRYDRQMVDVVKGYEGPVIIMHMKGTPGDMQNNPVYGDVVEEIAGFFQERVAWMEEKGIGRDRIVIDPGIGFGKTLEHNLAILRSITRFKELGFPVLIGHSRKSFLEKLLNLTMADRDCPTAVISALCTRQGVDILRVHDVRLSKQAAVLATVL